VDMDTCAVEVGAVPKPTDSTTAKCAVCRQVLGSAPRLWIQPSGKNKASRFNMHAGCAGRVLIRIMVAFNKINGNGNGHKPKKVSPLPKKPSEPVKRGIFTYMPDK
jgi:hypothetical protein